MTQKVLSKRERIVFLLDHWPDYWETLNAPDGAPGGDPDAVPLLPAMSRHPSVVELARAIQATRARMPNTIGHMMAFYCAEWRTTTQPIKRRTKKGKLEIVPMRVRQRVLPRWLEGDKVSLGVSFVTLEFRGEVFIPAELMEAA